MTTITVLPAYLHLRLGKTHLQCVSFTNLETDDFAKRDREALSSGKPKLTILKGSHINMHLSLRKNNDTFLEGIYPVSETTSKKGFISKQLKRFVTGGALAASVVGMMPALAGDNLIVNSDFESGNIQGWGLQDGKLPGATTVQSKVTRSGKYAVKLHIKRCSWMDPQCGPKPVRVSKPRSQLVHGKARFHVGREYWIGASIFIPNDWVTDTKSHDVFLQLHKTVAVNGPGTCEPGFSGTQPLQLDIAGNKWRIRHLTNNPSNFRVSANLPATVNKGQWTDFVFNFKFAYGNDGFHKIWINGKQVRNYKGSTMCAGKDRSDKASNMPYLLASLYKAGWKKSPNIKERTAYYDEIRVGNSSASYTDVAPGGKQTVVAAPKNQAPKVNAGADKTAQLNSPATITLNGSASDDGLPNGQLITSWSKVSGPGKVTFSTSSKLSTRATFSKEGKYVLRLSANDGKTSASDTTNVAVRQASTPKKNTASVPKQKPVQVVKKQPKQPVPVKNQRRPNRVKNGIVVYYDFEEGRGSTIKDVSRVGRPLNLKIRNTRRTSWVPGGLMIDGPTMLASSGKASKLINAVRATGEITVEAWIAPDNKSQKGPARIATLSSNGSNRNLTLGQDRSKYQVRLRTTKTGTNGTRPFLATRSNNVFPQLSHVVYTRNKKGIAKLYINGRRKVSKTIAGKLSNWNRNYRLALANELNGGRAWMGEYQMMTFYKRALSSDEVNQNFKAGPADDG